VVKLTVCVVIYNYHINAGVSFFLSDVLCFQNGERCNCKTRRVALYLYAKYAELRTHCQDKEGNILRCSNLQ